MPLCLESRFIYCYAECRFAECRHAECRRTHPRSPCGLWPRLQILAKLDKPTYFSLPSISNLKSWAFLTRLANVIEHFTAVIYEIIRLGKTRQLILWRCV